MPLRGDIRSVPVPGAVDGWLALHERYGRLPLPEVLAPAIELAEEGFPASLLLALASHLVHALSGAGELCPQGPLAVGQTVRLPGIGRTLRINGRAAINVDPELCASFTMEGKVPRSVIVVTAESVYTQCPKALVRSHLWDASRHLPESALPSNAGHFSQLLITKETQQNPKSPGTVVLQGVLKGLS